MAICWFVFWAIHKWRHQMFFKVDPSSSVISVMQIAMLLNPSNLACKGIAGPKLIKGEGSVNCNTVLFVKFAWKFSKSFFTFSLFCEFYFNLLNLKVNFSQQIMNDRLDSHDSPQLPSHFYGYEFWKINYLAGAGKWKLFLTFRFC